MGGGVEEHAEKSAIVPVVKRQAFLGYILNRKCRCLPNRETKKMYVLKVRRPNISLDNLLVIVYSS